MLSFWLSPPLLYPYQHSGNCLSVLLLTFVCVCGMHSDDKISNGTKIAWLLSFPNSGTTFTLQSVMQLSNRTVASNTCLKWVHDEALPTIYEDGGPYRLSSLDLPETYLLTRTHCAGHYPFRLRVDEDVFRRACKRTAVVERLGYKSKQGSYQDYPEKAIHLWRDPVENILSRWNHAKRHMPVLKPSFRWYCRIMDRLVWPLRGSDVPCKSEFYRYIQWHRNAMSLEDILNVLHVNYEDYENDDTMDNLLDFLELPRHQDGIPFTPSGSGKALFTSRQREVAWQYLQELATPEVWSKLERYAPIL